MIAHSDRAGERPITPLIVAGPPSRQLLLTIALFDRHGGDATELAEGLMLSLRSSFRIDAPGSLNWMSALHPPFPEKGVCTVIRFFRRRSKQVPSHSVSRVRSTFRPSFEMLEDRVVPSTVLNNLDSGAGSLRDAIATTPSGGTINFDTSLHGATITLASELGITNESLNILGLTTSTGAPDVTISGADSVRLFNISGMNTDVVSFSNLILTHGKSPAGNYGGAIKANTSLGLSNCKLTFNASLSADALTPGGGGAIDAHGSTTAPATALVTISNSVFDNNTVTDAFGTKGYGGAINTLDALEISNSTFTNNSAPGGGGAVDYFTNRLPYQSHLTISDSSFERNSVVNGSGGALEANSGFILNNITVLLSGDQFNDNHANGVDATHGYGGAADLFQKVDIGNVTVTVNNSASNVTSFTNNTAHYRGGALVMSDYAFGAAATVSATLDGGTQGIIFSGNTSDNEGGALFTSALSRNNAPDDLGGGTASVTVKHATFSNNTAGNAGGGIFAEAISAVDTGSATITIDSNTVNNNTAAQKGGGVFLLGFSDDPAAGTRSKIVLNNDTIAFNSSTTDNGGGIFGAGGGQSTVQFDFTNLTVVGNHSDAATGTGGGMYFDNAFPLLMLNVGNSIVSNNTAGSGTGKDINGTINSTGYNWILDGTGVVGTVASDIIGTNPLLDLAAGLTNHGGPTKTISFQAGSTAVGNGDPGLAGTLDQTGRSRQAGSVTPGAYDPNAL